MKILIHGNAPTVGTGYGVQIAHLARRLRDDGHDVAVSCTFGLQGKGRLWEGIQLYPSGPQSNGNDILPHHAMHFFGGDPKAGWILILTDLWVMVNPVLAEFNVIGWCPVDHLPAPPAVLGFFDRTDAIPVAMSQFGRRQLEKAGLAPAYAPLAVDTAVYKPTPTIEVAGQTVTGREMLGVPDDAFVVGMVAMNKDPFDRKGFNEAIRGFGAFWRDHPEAVLYLHTDPSPQHGGLDLAALATHAAVPAHAIRFSNWYALVNGFSDEQMAAMYTAFDVLLAPSRGEGFCVPLLEAQACGTPVIASDFTAQTELVRAGWTVKGQLLWDDTQKSSWIAASTQGIVTALTEAHKADRSRLGREGIEFAAGYDADRVYDEHWRPFLASLQPTEIVPADPIPEGPGAVAVIVPAMRRPHNVAPLVESFGDDVNVYFVCDPDDTDEIAAVKAAGASVIEASGTSFAVKANDGYRATSEPWIFLCGDDVRATPGWLDEARKVSHLADVVGTSDAADGNGNPIVQNGSHADHMLVRRSYIDMPGASLDGPGTLAAECYGHYYVDWELVRLAKARGRFLPCLAAVVEHLHPGLDKAPADLVYRRGMDHMDTDRETWLQRAPLIEMQRTSR